MALSKAVGVGLHHAAKIPVGFTFYNVGINNTEPGSRNWEQKVQKLEKDILDIFENQQVIANQHVDGIFFSEFGWMKKPICEDLHRWLVSVGVPCPGGVAEATKTFFEELLRRLQLTHLRVYADAPYVA